MTLEAAGGVVEAGRWPLAHEGAEEVNGSVSPGVVVAAVTELAVAVEVVRGSDSPALAIAG